MQVICGLMVVKTWDENYGDRKNNFGGSCLEGLRIIFSDSQVISQDNIAICIIPIEISRISSKMCLRLRENNKSLVSQSLFLVSSETFSVGRLNFRPGEKSLRGQSRSSSVQAITTKTGSNFLSSPRQNAIQNTLPFKLFRIFY